MRAAPGQAFAVSPVAEHKLISSSRAILAIKTMLRDAGRTDVFTGDFDVGLEHLHVEAHGQREVRAEVEVQGQREVCGGRGERQTERAIYRLIPSKARCRFS